MPQILGSERALFHRCIVEAKLNVDAFEINKERDAPGAIQHMGTGTVTVTYKPTGIARIYEVSTWSANFEDDLKSNVFQTREPSLH